MTKFIVTLLVVLTVLVQAQTGSSQTPAGDFSGISRKEIELLVSDLAVTNPDMIKRLTDDPAMKGKQLEDLRRLFAFASQAQKDGLVNDPANRLEYGNIRSEVVSANYDRELNKDKEAKAAFGLITDQQVKQFWSDVSRKDAREAEFKQFLDAKLAFMKRDDPSFDPSIVNEDDVKQARDYFAKVHIYADEYDVKVKAGTLDPNFVQKTDLQVKLQRAQFLSKLYAETAFEKIKVTDADITQYISAHPEFDTGAKRTKALAVLKRAKAGEDFAALANQFTEDQGNKGVNGKRNGGLYADVRKGVMVAPFEQAALALEPGQISPDLVESDFGFHIIKLEKKSEVKDENGVSTQIYDVRHILIETTYNDPANPTFQPQPIREYVTQKLGDEKQKKLIDDLVAANHVSVPDDYTIPVIPVKKVEKPKSPTARKTTAHRRTVTKKRSRR
ncbi:MAG: peptidylprolyl isomerase [Acidobacteriota bacterium]